MPYPPGPAETLGWDHQSREWLGNAGASGVTAEVRPAVQDQLTLAGTMLDVALTPS
jgi:hypothetical protein